MKKVKQSLTIISAENLKNLMAEIKLLILIPVGRGGSFFFQSLLDSHEEVIMFPDRYDYEYFKDESISNFCAKNQSFFNSDKSSYNIGNEFLEREEKINYFFDKKLFENIFNGLKEKVEISTDKDYFIVKHIAYAILTGRDINNLKYILCHVHVLFPPQFNLIKKLLKDFSTAKMIVMTRDFRESIASFVSIHTSKTPSIREVELKRSIWSYIKQAYLPFFEISKLVSKDKLMIIDLNRFHSDGIYNMRKISKWLKIQEKASLTQSTVLGQIWYGNSSNGKKMNGFDKKKSKTSFKSKFSKLELEFIETFTRPFLDKFQYEVENNDANKSKINKIHLFNSNLYKVFNTKQKEQFLNNDNKLRVFSYLRALRYIGFPVARLIYYNQIHYTSGFFSEAIKKVNAFKIHKSSFL